jgi:Zn-dependent peptidase ImmA (M78 family)/DNA-binding XRE family transcriptional regulator
MAIGERLKMSRRMSGLSQRELAEKTGVSATAISKYERGIITPGSGVLLKLCDILGIKPEYLLRPDDYAVKLRAPSFRKFNMTKKEEDSIIEIIRDWLERYLEVEQLAGSSLKFRIDPAYPITVSSYDEIEEIASNFRREWNLGSDPIENLTALFEDKGIKVGSVPGPESFEALTFWYDDGTPVIAVRQDRPGDRQRFSLAHELGHLLLKAADHLDPEQVANRFAGAFLVPWEVVAFELGARRKKIGLFELHLLKHKYGLSMQAWIYRARDCGIITNNKLKRIFDMFTQNEWREREPGDQIKSEAPERMERLVIRLYAERSISKSRASELLGKSISDFCRIEEEKHGGFPIEICY